MSVVVACYNESGNIDPMVVALKEIFAGYPQYDFEIIFIDNCSTDGTRGELRVACERDPFVRAILNVRNFGHIRSPVHGMLQARGDAVILMAADFEDPPALIPQFLAAWDQGAKVVAGVKRSEDSSFLLKTVRPAYYRLLNYLSEVQLVNDFTGFGLYDKAVLGHVRRLEDSYPYFRGLISELGYPVERVYFDKPARRCGFSKSTLATNFDMALLGLVSHSRRPLRIMTVVGLVCSFLSLCLGLYYLLYKLVYWYQFELGSAPLLVGIYLLGSIQLFFLGLVGEYIGNIHLQILNRPLVVEAERLNFTDSMHDRVISQVAS